MSLMDISRQKQSRKSLHTQPITAIISATSPHFSPPSWCDMEDYIIFIGCSCKINLQRLCISIKLFFYYQKIEKVNIIHVLKNKWPKWEEEKKNSRGYGYRSTLLILYPYPLSYLIRSSVKKYFDSQILDRNWTQFLLNNNNFTINYHT
jgi:hypothetical protein